MYVCTMHAQASDCTHAACTLYSQVRDEYAERYGISLEELERRQARRVRMAEPQRAAQCIPLPHTCNMCTRLRKTPPPPTRLWETPPLPTPAAGHPGRRAHRAQSRRVCQVAATQPPPASGLSSRPDRRARAALPISRQGGTAHRRLSGAALGTQLVQTAPPPPSPGPKTELDAPA